MVSPIVAIAYLYGLDVHDAIALMADDASRAVTARGSAIPAAVGRFAPAQTRAGTVNGRLNH